MPTPRLAAAFLVLAAAAMPVIAADVGVSINIGQPNFYGQIELGNYPRPQLIYPQPVVIAPRPHPAYAPVYLRVPPGHAKNWKKHCRQYAACGRPVYFVKDDWYQNVYAPDYRERHGRGHGKGHGKHRDRDD